MSFNDQVIWITGASSGIGEALATALSQAGARLILSARREAELERVRRLCQDPERHLVLPLDMSDFDAVAQSVEVVRAWTPRLDIVIENAGVSQRALVKDTLFSVDEQIFKINFLGVVAHTKAILPWFLEQGRGHFVVVSSLVGKFATPVRSSYSASKHALHGFFDALRAELNQDQFHVTLLCPGYVHTRISYNALTGDGSAQGVLDRAQARGMSLEVFVPKALSAIAARKPEVYIGGKETWGVLVHRLLPSLFRRLIRRVNVT